MVQRLKVVEKEREGLEGKKQEAEDFIDKQSQMFVHKVRPLQPLRYNPSFTPTIPPVGFRLQGLFAL